MFFSLKNFMKDDSGATAIEYAFIGLLVALVIAAGVMALGV